jgi:hypothetical protein
MSPFDRPKGSYRSAQREGTAQSQAAVEHWAATAARLVVEEGLEYGPAKRKAARILGLSGGRAFAMPDNDRVEDEVRTYIALFHADTQPSELAALRTVALQWMQRLGEFRPHLCGAVWRGTATRLSSVHIQLFCDDPKSAEIALINLGVPYEVSGATGPRGTDVSVLCAHSRIQGWAQPATVLLSVLDFDDLRGALRTDPRGRSERGDLDALQRLMAAEESAR